MCKTPGGRQAPSGYRTQAIVSHTYVAEELRFGQGFQRFDSENALGHGHVCSPSITEKRTLMSDEDVAYVRALYDSEIRFTDRYLGVFWGISSSLL